MRTLIFSAVLIFAACTGEDSNGQQQGAASNVAVAQGAANTSFQPAFAGQTRAPAASSGITIAQQALNARLEHPWAIVFLPDGRMLVTERPGRLRIVSREGQLSAPIQGLPRVDARGQGGLLDVVLSPSFVTDRFVYWSYSEPRGSGQNATAVARGRLSDDGARVENVQRIFQQNPAWRSTAHFGSRLVFDREGRLFVTLGERSNPEPRVLAQDLSATIGKLVRINADGTIPADNPFVAQANARGEIWSSGHRNIQGADLNPESGAIWTIEHGPQGGDELNVPQAGRNYGWPVISYGEDYSGAPIGEGIAVRDGMEQPIYYWDPVIAPGDMDFYRGELFPWRGDILIGALGTAQLVRLDIEDERVVREERFDLGIGRIRDMAEDETGALWVITDEDNGRIVRLTPQQQ